MLSICILSLSMWLQIWEIVHSNSLSSSIAYTAIHFTEAKKKVEKWAKGNKEGQTWSHKAILTLKQPFLSTFEKVCRRHAGRKLQESAEIHWIDATDAPLEARELSANVIVIFFHPFQFPHKIWTQFYGVDDKRWEMIAINPEFDNNDMCHL